MRGPREGCRRGSRGGDGPSLHSFDIYRVLMWTDPARLADAPRASLSLLHPGRTQMRRPQTRGRWCRILGGRRRKKTSEREDFRALRGSPVWGGCVPGPRTRALPRLLPGAQGRRRGGAGSGEAGPRGARATGRRGDSLLPGPRGARGLDGAGGGRGWLLLPGSPRLPQGRQPAGPGGLSSFWSQDLPSPTMTFPGAASSGRLSGF